MAKQHAAIPRAARPSMILDSSGKPMGYVGAPAHQAADIRSQELVNFLPSLLSADAAYLPERDRIVSRVHDLARNDGWTASTLNRYVDQAIGANFRLSYMPDHTALGIDHDAAMAFSELVESQWAQYTLDPRNYVDARERLSWSALTGLAFRHRMRDGEAFGVLQWISRPWFSYRTAVQVMSPERVSNPNGEQDSDTLRRGVRMNKRGAPIGYYFRATHPGDRFYGQTEQFRWEYLDRRTPWGRPIVLHVFEPEDAEQTRGKSSLAAVVKQVFMMNKYAAAEVQAALLNAILAAYVEAPMDAEQVAEAMTDASELDAYQSARAAFHETSKLTLNGVRIAQLFPGEKIGMVNAARPNANYPDFEKRLLRYFATATGQSYEQLSADFSETNYSSVRAGLMEFWKFLTSRRDHFAAHWCTPIFAAWLEEAVDNGSVTLPKGAPDFWRAYGAYTSAATWNGPGRGWVDPVKEATASQIRVDSEISCGIDEANESGKDFRKILQSQAYEGRLREKYGLPNPRSREIGVEPSSASSVDPNADPDEADDKDNAARKARVQRN